MTEEMKEVIRKELEKKTNKDLLIDAVVDIATLKEATKDISTIKQDVKNMNGKARDAFTLATNAMTKSDLAIKESSGVRRYLDKLIIAVVGVAFTAIIALVIALV